MEKFQVTKNNTHQQLVDNGNDPGEEKVGRKKRSASKLSSKILSPKHNFNSSGSKQKTQSFGGSDRQGSPDKFNSGKLKKEKISTLKIREELRSNSLSENTRQLTDEQIQEEQKVASQPLQLQHSNVFNSASGKNPNFYPKQIVKKKKQRSKSNTNYQYLQYTHDMGSQGMSQLRRLRNNSQEEASKVQQLQLEGPKNLIRELKEFERKARQKLKSDLMRVKIEQSLREKVSVSVNSGELENTIAQNLIRDEIYKIYNLKVKEISHPMTQPRIFLQEFQHANQSSTEEQQKYDPEIEPSQSQSESLQEQTNLVDHQDQPNQARGPVLDLGEESPQNHDNTGANTQLGSSVSDTRTRNQMIQFYTPVDGKIPNHPGLIEQRITEEDVNIENQIKSQAEANDQDEIDVDIQFAQFGDGQPKIQYSDRQQEFKASQLAQVQQNIQLREFSDEIEDTDLNQIEESKAFVSIGHANENRHGSMQNLMEPLPNGMNSSSLRIRSEGVQIGQLSRVNNIALDSHRSNGIYIGRDDLGSQAPQIQVQNVDTNLQPKMQPNKKETNMHLNVGADQKQRLQKKMEALFDKNSIAIDSQRGRKQKISRKKDRKLAQMQKSCNKEAYIKQSQKDLRDRLEEESNLSLTKLKNHIRQNHPKKTNEEWWPILSSTGSFFNFKNIDIPEFMQDIGLGASLYILTLKSLGMIFLLLTILNIPALYFFYSGQEADFREMTGLNKIFFQFSLGNIGEYRFACTTINYAENISKVPMTCEIGIMKQLVSFGLTSHHNQQCVPRLIENSHAYQTSDGAIHSGRYEGKNKQIKDQNITEFSQFVDYQSGCGSTLDEKFLNSDFRHKLEEQFRSNCVGQHECMIDLPYDTIKPECRKAIEKRSQSSRISSTLRDKLGFGFVEIDKEIEPELIIVSLCEINEIQLAGTTLRASKSSIAIIIVIIDIFSLFIVQIFLNLLILMQKNFAKQFDMQTVEMRDFTVRMEKLPSSFAYYDDEIQMKFEIWSQIQDRIQDGKNVGIIKHDINAQIVEINFAYKNKEILYTLRDIIKMCETIELHNIQLHKAQTKKERQKAQRLIWTKHAKLKQVVEEFDSKYKGMTIVEAIKASNNSSLYDQITQVYITFMSMDMRDLVLDVLFRRDSFQPRELRNYYKQQSKKNEDNFKEKMFSFLNKNSNKPMVADKADPDKDDAPVKIEIAQLGQDEATKKDESQEQSGQNKETQQNKYVETNENELVKMQKDQEQHFKSKLKRRATSSFKKIDLSVFVTQDNGKNSAAKDKAIKAIIDEIWDNYDDDNSGDLDKEECRGFVKDALGNLGEEEEFDEKGFEEVFDAFDEDQSGKVDQEEMIEFIKKLLQVPNGEEEKASTLSEKETFKLKSEKETKMQKQFRKSITMTLEKEIKRIESQIQTWEPPDPEYILWENIGYSQSSRTRRKCLSVLIAIALVMFTVWLISYFTEQKNELFESQVPIECLYEVTKEDAYKDMLLEPKDRQNVIGCYCYEYLLEHKHEFPNHNFKDIGGPDAPSFCQIWFKGYSMAQFFSYASSLVVVVINVLAQEIFEIAARNEKQLNTASENQTIFKLIFFQSFINIGFVMLMTDKIFLAHPIMNTNWYFRIGTSICFSMLLQTISTKGGHMSVISLNLLMRCWDRRCKLKWVSDLGEEIPNTRHVRQGDLDQLYTGPQILIGYQFACMFTFIFVCLAYSAGMPFMYPIGMVYFFFTYWFDKVCLMRFYQKTMVFNEELPIQSTQLFKFAIMIHLVFAAFMYATSSILHSSSEFIDFKFDLDQTHAANFTTPHFCIFLANVFICMVMYIIYRLNFAKISVWLLKYLQRVEEFEQQLFTSSEEDSEVDRAGLEFKAGTSIFAGQVDLEDNLGAQEPQEDQSSKSKNDKKRDHKQEQGSSNRPSQRASQRSSQREPHGEELKMSATEKRKRAETPLLSYQNSSDIQFGIDTPQNQQNDSMFPLKQNSKRNTRKQPKDKILKEGGTSSERDKKSEQSNISAIQSLMEDDNESFNDGAGIRNKKLGSSIESRCSKSNCSGSHNGNTATFFYGEILFDYIDVYYENLIQYIVRLKNAKSEIMKLYKKRPDKKKRFEEYIQEQENNKRIMEEQITFYYDYILERLESVHDSDEDAFDEAQEEQPPIQIMEQQKPIVGESSRQETNQQLSFQNKPAVRPSNLSKVEASLEKNSFSSFSSHQYSDSDKSCIHQVAAMTEKEREFQSKLDYLNDNFDEDQLNEHFFPNNLRCTSFSQSYNLTDNAEFNDADLAIERANLLILDPIIFKQADKPKKSKSKSKKSTKLKI